MSERLVLSLWEPVLTPEEYRGFLRGNVIKFSMRAGRKGGSDDAGKARHYQQFLDATRDA